MKADPARIPGRWVLTFNVAVTARWIPITRYVQRIVDKFLADVEAGIIE